MPEASDNHCIVLSVSLAEKEQAQRSYVTCSRSHSQRMAVATLGPHLGTESLRCVCPLGGRPSPRQLWLVRVRSRRAVCFVAPAPSLYITAPWALWQSQAGAVGRNDLLATHRDGGKLPTTSQRPPPDRTLGRGPCSCGRGQPTPSAEALASGLGSVIEERSGIFRQMRSCPSTAATIMQIRS